jgi:peptidoglycan/LPS O-acetylase OafA/YrhL
MSRRLPSLDGLRGVSIALVLISHLTGTRGAPAFLDFREDLGNLGVRTFFVISGFLITSLLLDERAATGTISLKKFYLRRMFRIFPASYAYILVMAFLSWFGIIVLKHNDLLCAATYTVNNHYDHSWWIGHLWSLSVEEQFYLLWPFAMVFLGTAAALRVAVATVIAAPLIRIFLMVFVPSQRVGIGSIFPTVADAMAVGCILACVREQLIADSRYAHFLRSFWFVLVPVAVFVLNYPLSAKSSALIGVSLLNITIALCIDWCVRTPSGLIGRVLNSRLAVWIGALSYSLYLWQQPFLNRHSSLTINAVPLNLMLAIIAAVLSYYLIEKPFLRIKARFEVDHRYIEQPAVPQD